MPLSKYNDCAPPSLRSPVHQSPAVDMPHTIPSPEQEDRYEGSISSHTDSRGTLTQVPPPLNVRKRSPRIGDWGFPSSTIHQAPPRTAQQQQSSVGLGIDLPRFLYDEPTSPYGQHSPIPGLVSGHDEDRLGLGHTPASGTLSPYTPQFADERMDSCNPAVSSSPYPHKAWDYVREDKPPSVPPPLPIEPSQRFDPDQSTWTYSGATPDSLRSPANRDSVSTDSDFEPAEFHSPTYRMRWRMTAADLSPLDQEQGDAEMLGMPRQIEETMQRQDNDYESIYSRDDGWQSVPNYNISQSSSTVTAIPILDGMPIDPRQRWSYFINRAYENARRADEDAHEAEMQAIRMRIHPRFRSESSPGALEDGKSSPSSLMSMHTYMCLSEQQ